jgi:hypothetical protein
MDKYTCTCGGENPNCFKCDGTGMVSSLVGTLGRPKTLLESFSRNTLQPKKSSTSKRQSRKSSALNVGVTPSVVKSQFRRIPAYTSCPICLQLIPTGTLKKHRRSAHPTQEEVKATNQLNNLKKSLAAPDQKILAAPDQKILYCPICSIQTKNLEKHINKIHIKVLDSKEKQFLKEVSKVRACTKCDFNCVSDLAMLVHLIKAHGLLEMFIRQGGNKRNLSIYKGVGTKKSLLAEGYDQSSDRKENLLGVNKTNFEKSESPSLDAKYGWGSFRDNGQFGSYPSHDAMDDESMS